MLYVLGETLKRRIQNHLENGFLELGNFVHYVPALKWWHLQQQQGQATEEKY